MTLRKQSEFLSKRSRRKEYKKKKIVTQKRFLRGTRRLLRRRRYRYRRVYPRNTAIDLLALIANIVLFLIFSVVSLFFGGFSETPLDVYILYITILLLVTIFIYGDKSKQLSS
ncbi:MAG: hypothetical protein ACW98K_00175 [Candidatus Kariarchaeaceae archaeon]|jgi:hypothetical protein